jgi:hypothetical protein
MTLESNMSLIGKEINGDKSLLVPDFPVSGKVSSPPPRAIAGRGLSSNGAENWDRASSLLDRPLRPPNDHGVFPRIIFCNHLFFRTFMHQKPQTTREALPYVIPLRRCESIDAWYQKS